MFDNYPEYLSVAQVCDILSVEKHSVYRLINNGRISAIRSGEKLWRIPKNSLALYVLNESGIPVELEDVNDYI